MSDANEPVSYADAGVDLAAADRSVELLSDVVKRASRPEVLGGIGGFGGLFQLDVARYREPVLVSGTDGVGTKVDLARRLGVLDTVGIDLVAMVVDDLVVPGAEPLFFNDYVSVGKLDPDRVADLVRGIADGCAIAGCALVGGETAEHPGLLADDEFDLAGFGVGVVEKDAILGPHRVQPGDAVVAMASSGLHSNGYSLVRRIVADRDLAARHGLARPLGEVLLTPTRIYALDVLALIAEVETHALCHVTGGGLPGNLPRVLPDGLGVTVDTATWAWPEVFSWLAEAGPVATDEMWRTFNCGVGMVAIVPDDRAADAVALLQGRGVDAWTVGAVTDRSGVELTGGP
ncbi:phosphoribosylformylglycinamidine cyclo-ligase [Nitriliruptor alkaliphilus]|uniref:phosphoribosylformylglycinamidine cyclo-ligase n=1 Tax=Nitriliruptor alkaliphilus TaxID=427918 RepID=UPI000697A6F3|nr:phosphoribosylformylglycinamidine cyclo-ligase [Nitriliruptor alkaliphilus]